MEKIRVFKVTPEDWYPSYRLPGYGVEEIMLVEVSLLALGPRPLANNEMRWRVCVWGGDDCGMERDFVEKQEAIDCFMSVIGLAKVTRSGLKDQGFWPA